MRRGQQGGSQWMPETAEKGLARGPAPGLKGRKGRLRGLSPLLNDLACPEQPSALRRSLVNEVGPPPPADPEPGCPMELRRR